MLGICIKCQSKITSDLNPTCTTCESSDFWHVCPYCCNALDNTTICHGCYPSSYVYRVYKYHFCIHCQENTPTVKPDICVTCTNHKVLNNNNNHNPEEEKMKQTIKINNIELDVDCIEGWDISEKDNKLLTILSTSGRKLEITFKTKYCRDAYIQKLKDGSTLDSFDSKLFKLVERNYTSLIKIPLVILVNEYCIRDSLVKYYDVTNEEILDHISTLYTVGGLGDLIHISNTLPANITLKSKSLLRLKPEVSEMLESINSENNDE